MTETSALSVLIVDDAAFSRRMLRKYIEAEGYNALEALNGQQALEIVQQHLPSCILTDLLMPDLDGFGLLQALQDQGCTIPTVIISADIQDAAKQRGLDLGASAFLNKPIKEAEVRQTVRQLVQQKGVNYNAANH